jgi:CYTH domain-containing protein
MGREIERKFRVVGPPPWLERAPAQLIDQGYLAIAETSEVRLRRINSESVLTVKRGHGENRLEEEVALTNEQLAALWPLTEGSRLHKRRHTVDGAPAIEVDVYLDDLAGLIIAEVEFDSTDAADAFEPPDWIGEEVTDDERYANQQLALHGLPSDA